MCDRPDFSSGMNMPKRSSVETIESRTLNNEVGTIYYKQGVGVLKLVLWKIDYHDNVFFHVNTDGKRASFRFSPLRLNDRGHTPVTPVYPLTYYEANATCYGLIDKEFSFQDYFKIIGEETSGTDRNFTVIVEYELLE